MIVAENLRRKDMILDWNFFLNLKAFFFSLPCIVHINFAHQNVIPLPSIKYDVLRIQNSNLYKVYALQNDVYRDLYKS